MANNQYEWFKGPQANHEKGSNWKGNVKTTWKFTRIFLFFSLFFFSMWGCVQTFTSKTDNSVGKGVSIYASKDEISPQVTSIRTTTVDKLYNVTIESKNKWLSGRKDPVDFKSMRKSYNDKFGTTFTLDRALKGGNSVAFLTTPTDKSGSYIKDSTNSELAVATTVFKDSKTKLAYVKNTVTNFLENLVYFKSNTPTIHYHKIIDPSKYVEADGADPSKLYIIPTNPIVTNKKDAGSIELGSLTNVNKWIKNDKTATLTDIKKEEPADNVTTDKIVNSKTAINLWSKVNITNWNQIYNLNVMSAILQDFKVQIGDTVTNIANNLEFPGKTETANGLPNPKLKIAINRLYSIRFIENLVLSQLYGVNINWTEERQEVKNGVKVTVPDPLIDQLENLKTSYVFNVSKNYKPIATWGQAWEMGRGSGPFYGIFVYPIAWTTAKITEAFPFMAGWESFLSIIFVVVIISMITFLLSFKGTLQQQRMTELNSKKAVIEAKYEGYKGNKQMENRKRQEVSGLYKKEGINPLASLGTIFITMPFFLAMWRTIGTNQHLKSTIWLGINFSLTSYKQLLSGHFVYLPLLVIAGGTNIISQLYPRWLTKRRDKNRINVHQKQAMKKANKTQNIMMFAFTFITLIFTAGLQVYFIIRSIWRVGESTLTHRILIYQKRRRVKLRK